MTDRRIGALLAVLAVTLAGCANIPDQSTPQVVGNLSAQTPGATPIADTRDPYQFVRNFIDAAGDPYLAKGYLTDAAKASWNGETPPTIIAETYSAEPIPAQERKQQGDEGGGNDVTVRVKVNNLGRLGPDAAFIPTIGSAEYRVPVHRQSTDSSWRIQTPPNTPLITLPRFKEAYKRVSVFYFDPASRVTVPDLRYVAARPATGAADRVLRLLLNGPSETLKNAVQTALPPDAGLGFNAVPEADGPLVVNLTRLGDKSVDERKRIVAQVVLSLRDVVQSKIRVLADGHPLLSDKTDWWPSDISSYDPNTRPNAELTGMFTAPNGRVNSLRDGTPIPGPAGSGEYKVSSAAQSVDGKSLAVVQDLPGGGVRLRVGGIGTPLREVDLAAATLTRPTWALAAPGSTSNEVWTVQNGVDIVRVVHTGNDTWAPSPVISSDMSTFGPITDLRLSRDGVRIAAVAGGKLMVASVVRANDTVSIRSPRDVRAGDLTGVVGVDWLNQDMLVVATGQPAQPVINVPVDGFDPAAYNSSNLNAQITAITAAPDRSVLVADDRGIWESPDTLRIWKLTTQVPGARPFYPG
jgi:lipoprotein LpqB-like beta-propeller protein/sporulation and spore germination protein